MVEHIVQQIMRDSSLDKVKDMNPLYNKGGKPRVVKTSVHKGVQYWITTTGDHPCAYVGCSEDFLDKHQDEYDLIYGIGVHGGVTFCGSLSTLKVFHSESSAPEELNLKNTYAFGWDYAHWSDWEAYRSDEDNEMYDAKKWTLDEIEKECHNVIDQYLKILEDDAAKADEKKLIILKNPYLQGMVDDDEINLKPYFTPGEYEIKTFESKEERDGYIKAVNDFQPDVKVIYGEKLKKVIYE